jgi:3-hydroxyisobutyrate dehydrogenase-like beta-hydroxyacid dehydrogenase
MNQRAGMVGIGLMGHGIARNLMEKGYALITKAHRNRAPLEDLIRRGAREADTHKEIAENSDIVFISVTGGPEVEEVVYGPHGLLEGCHPGLTVADCTTTEIAMTERVYRDLSARGVAFADTPLNGSPADAEAGRVTTMVGASPSTFEAIRPALETYSRRIFHVGAVGSAARLKLIYNFFSMSQVALISEALCTCAASDIDLQTYYDVVSLAGGNSGIFQAVMKKLLEGDLGGLQHSLYNAEKDIRYYKHLVEDLRLAGIMCAASHLSYAQALRMGDPQAPVASLVKVQEKVNGIRILKS